MPRMTAIRNLMALIAVAFAATSASAQQAATQWPTKPIKIIVGAAAGGPTDIIARVVGNELSKLLGQNVIIDNRPGAGHRIGTTAMANAIPDGYTFGAVTTPFVVDPALYKKLPYNTDSLKAVSLLASSPLVLIVNPSVPAKSVQELVALAKQKPGVLNMATPGILTGPHLAGALFNHMAGIQVVQVAYGGGPQATTAILRGEAQFYFDTPSGATPYIKAGKVRALAQTFSERIPQLPDLPTVAEFGFPGYEFNSWTGLVAPEGVPSEIMSRFEQAVQKAMKNEEVRKRLIAAGFVPVGSSAKDFAALVKKELAKWQTVIPQIGVHVQ